MTYPESGGADSGGNERSEAAQPDITCRWVNAPRGSDAEKYLRELFGGLNSLRNYSPIRLLVFGQEGSSIQELQDRVDDAVECLLRAEKGLTPENVPWATTVVEDAEGNMRRAPTLTGPIGFTSLPGRNPLGLRSNERAVAFGGHADLGQIQWSAAMAELIRRTNGELLLLGNPDGPLSIPLPR